MNLPETKWALLDDPAALARIGARVRAMRERRGLRQKDAAARAGVAVQTYNNLERTGCCTLATLMAVVRAFGAFDLMDILEEDAA